MKILHIDTEVTWRGGENQVRYLIQGGLKAGVDMRLCAKEGSEVKRRLEDQVPVLSLPLRGELDWISALQIARYARREGIDILDAHTSHAHGIAMLAKMFQPTLKVVVHRRVDFVPKQHFFNRIKYLHKNVDRYVAISQAIFSILKDFGIPEEKLALAASAVDPSPFQAIDAAMQRERLIRGYGLKSQTTILGTAAALTAQKDYTTLIQALAHLNTKGIDFCCFIAGDGPERQQILDLIRSLQLGERVHFLGWVGEMVPYLKALDIFVLSSKLEGLGTSIQDATYAGATVCATSVGGIPEMIQHGYSGWLSPPSDPAALARNLEDAILHPDLRNAYTLNAKNHIMQAFGLEAMVSANLAVYRSLLSRL